MYYRQRDPEFSGSSSSLCSSSSDLSRLIAGSHFSRVRQYRHTRRDKQKRFRNVHYKLDDPYDFEEMVSLKSVITKLKMKTFWTYLSTYLDRFMAAWESPTNYSKP
ncbi:uncharacterized protein LOC108045303 [Drosophila rhopaloa]|uniref:Uncharacterized protein LOC108045303 n=1 Tax=Drosophila rhopaloa TaxID=1041015 RepID=A0A6P4EPS7_DRORH|nr:uncharacterized protein LOC108045303 [Drosophila rhopaloa]